MGALREDARNRARNGGEMRKRVKGLNISAGWKGKRKKIRKIKELNGREGDMGWDKIFPFQDFHTEYSSEKLISR